ncbi:Syntaxin-10 [Harpegnathos saltator]|uniref:Syntaxin-10 n=1 Tax=Harpegnathos saltator TaxID=610380 RepID=E2BNQ9_HARSA|nr:Syntaxin-10 [Harpegnathos saltator]
MLIGNGRPIRAVGSYPRCDIAEIRHGVTIDMREVCKALNKNRGLYGRWNELQDVAIASPNTPVSGGISAAAAAAAPISRDELDWTTTELRKALRSIEWDLDDLEDTIYILCSIASLACASFHATYTQS